MLVYANCRPQVKTPACGELEAPGVFGDPGDNLRIKKKKTGPKKYNKLVPITPVIIEMLVTVHRVDRVINLLTWYVGL